MNKNGISDKISTPKRARNLSTIIHLVMMIWIATFTLIAIISGHIGLLIIAFVKIHFYYKENKIKIKKIFDALEKVYG